MMYCKKCGAEQNGDSNFCIFCGQRFLDEPNQAVNAQFVPQSIPYVPQSYGYIPEENFSAPPSAPHEKSSRLPVWVSFFISAAVILSILLGCFYFVKEGKPSEYLEEFENQSSQTTSSKSDSWNNA